MEMPKDLIRLDFWKEYDGGMTSANREDEWTHVEVRARAGGRHWPTFKFYAASADEREKALYRVAELRAFAETLYRHGSQDRAHLIRDAIGTI